MIINILRYSSFGIAEGKKVNHTFVKLICLGLAESRLYWQWKIWIPDVQIGLTATGV